MSKNFNTSHTLLGRAREGDESAWDDFIDYYQRFIYHMLHVMKTPSKDIDDLSQTVLVKLWKNLKSYDKDKGKFRSWLSVVIRNAVLSYFTSHKNKNKEWSIDAHEESNENFLPSSPAEIDAQIESEWKNYVAQRALDNIKSLFSDNAIRVFSLSLEGLSNEEISEQCELKKTSVAELKARVKSRFIQEIKALIQEMEG